MSPARGRGEDHRGRGGDDGGGRHPGAQYRGARHTPIMLGV